MVDLVKDISDSQTMQSIEGFIKELVERYNTGLRELLDKTCPATDQGYNSQTKYTMV